MVTLQRKIMINLFLKQCHQIHKEVSFLHYGDKKSLRNCHHNHDTAINFLWSSNTMKVFRSEMKSYLICRIVFCHLGINNRIRSGFDSHVGWLFVVSISGFCGKQQY
jgi:hypothetical protein